MALKGTLKDFGIADILQLIGHQLKTGVLKLASKNQEVLIYWIDGNVVKAESATRDRRDLLGSLLVRAEVIQQEQLDTALEIQRRTLKRLGDILVDSGYLTRDVIRDFTRLQTTETIYKLFNWKSGTYEFEQQEFDFDPESYEPIRAESVLMEGFRMIDEWPFIRKRINSYAMTFEVLKPLPEVSESASEEPAGEDFLDGIDAAFDAAIEGKAEEERPRSGTVGESERLVHGLIKPGRDVQKLIDLSRLGEFETCKALLNLLNAGLILAIPARKGAEASAPSEMGALKAPRAPWRIMPALVRVATTALLAVAVLALIWLSGVDRRGLWRSGQLIVDNSPVEEALGWRGEGRLERALQVFYLEHGRYPERLDLLVTAKLLDPRELRYPFSDEYAYRSSGDSYRLARPFR
ncbi:MAG: DUF4388 domain-containing protein [Deltaproteobacteria bacterium]|nr:DUF4388 domain-containing protein [Deltaproteobacteria bacterium]